MSPLKTIKRYANRKLYDTDRSCYVTLEDIADMIRAGEEIRVVDNKSGEDLTSVTLAQIIFEAEKKQNFMSLQLLRGLIQQGGELASKPVEFVQDKAREAVDSAARIRSDLNDQIGRVRKTTNEKIAAVHETPSKVVSELLETSQKAIDELQRGVEEKFRGKPDTHSKQSIHADMKDLKERLDSLESQLENINQ